MSHPNSEASCSQDLNPFEGLLISDNAVLNQLENRYACDKCHKSRKYFCYTCFIPCPKLKPSLPLIKLPLKIDIIKHRKEIDGKSTAAHAAILAAEDVKIYTYPDFPNYENEDKVVLIFPSQTALKIGQLFENSLEQKLGLDVKSKGFHKGTLLKHSTRDIPDSEPSSVIRKFDNFESKNCLPIKKAVFIDSTWNQSRGIYKDPRIKKLPCVVFQNRVSQFWRTQRGSPAWYLATIEAMHQFLLEIHINTWGVHPNYKGLSCCFKKRSLEVYSKFISQGEEAYCGQYDDLLFFFQHMYRLIHTYYNHEDLYAYKRRMT